MTPIIVPAYAAIFAIIFVVLSFRVADMRRTTKTGLGTGGSVVLERRIRVHANFAEYVPFALLLLSFAEMQRWSRLLLHVLCIVLLVARLIHVYGVSQEPEDVRLRGAAVISTFFVLLVAAVLLLISALRVA